MSSSTTTTTAEGSKYPPLVTHIYTADPSAHVFNNTLYIFPSHDRETSIEFNDNGDQYDMVDYHVLSLPNGPLAGAPATDHGIALSLEQVPWASRQLWAPTAAQGPDRKFYLYFPARDKQGIFRIGAAVSDTPEGPYKAQENYIKGSYTIDPAAFTDTDGSTYLYIGGLWGGQLQCWQKGTFDASLSGPQEPSGEGVAALLPLGAKMAEDMVSFDGALKGIEIRDEEGKLIAADDHARRYFEGPHMHKYKDTYYFSYSTGDTHFIAYATGSSPLGPFTYRGKILDPVVGWTTHHSIVEFQGKWWLFYHDCELSKGVDHLRSVKVREIVYDDQGDIHLADPQ